MYETCVICGLKRVLPQFEIDVEVGTISNFGVLICEDCYNSEDPNIIADIGPISSKKKLPF